MVKVLVVGVAVLDFIFDVETFPTSPDKYRALDARIVNGGNAANASIAISRLGGEAVLCARTGTDVVSDVIVSGLKSQGVDCSCVRQFDDNRASFSSIYIDPSGERQIVNYRDNSLTKSADWLAELVPDDVDIVLSETRWPEGAKFAMQLARDRGIPGIMDGEVPVFEGEEAIRLASHVAFSANAVMQFTGRETVEEAVLSAGKVLEGMVFATDGERGVFWDEDGKVRNSSSFPVTPVDTLGAGDVWHGAFALKLGSSEPLENTVRYASAAAALKCERVGGGSGAPTADEVATFLEKF